MWLKHLEVSTTESLESDAREFNHFGIVFFIYDLENYLEFRLVAVWRGNYEFCFSKSRTRTLES